MNIYTDYLKTIELLVKDYAKAFDNLDDFNGPQNSDFTQLRISTKNLVKKICGEDSPHYQELQNIDSSNAFSKFVLEHYLGVLRALKFDLKNNLLSELKLLISAEIISEFIDQAEYLHKNGFISPAASLAGAVLEDALRRLALSNKIEVPDKTSIEWLNVELSKKEIYYSITKKQITAHAEVRNNADHGRFDKFSEKDVAEMISWVKRFLSEYLK